MRRGSLAALMMTLALLSGCGSGGEAEFEALRAGVSAAAEVRLTAEVTADCGESVETYTLSCVSDADGSEVEVLAPALVAGVRARISSAGGALVYEGLELSAGDLGAGLSPVSALPALLDAVRTAHLDAAWSEGGCTAVKLTPSDELEIVLRLDENGLPARAELTERDSGRVLVTCLVTEFSMTQG